MYRTTVLWKMKAPLQINIFMWYLKRGVVLTKDNLVRWNWSENKLCVFCSQPKSIQYLFFDCHFARFLWRVIQATFNIDVLISITHMFNDWVAGLGNQFKKLVLVGGAALCWALWTNMNDIVFDNAIPRDILARVQLQMHEEITKEIKSICRSVEATMTEIFVSHGWRFTAS
jgi:hypothetical protein